MFNFNDYDLIISDIYFDSNGEKCVNFDFSEKDNDKHAYFKVQLNEDVFLPICYDFSNSEVMETFTKLFVARSNPEIAEMFGKESEWEKITRCIELEEGTSK